MAVARLRLPPLPRPPRRPPLPHHRADHGNHHPQRTPRAPLRLQANRLLSQTHRRLLDHRARRQAPRRYQLHPHPPQQHRHPQWHPLALGLRPQRPLGGGEALSRQSPQAHLGVPELAPWMGPLFQVSSRCALARRTWPLHSSLWRKASRSQSRSGTRPLPPRSRRCQTAAPSVNAKKARAGAARWSANQLDRPMPIMHQPCWRTLARTKARACGHLQLLHELRWVHAWHGI